MGKLVKTKLESYIEISCIAEFILGVVLPIVCIAGITSQKQAIEMGMYIHTIILVALGCISIFIMHKFSEHTLKIDEFTSLAFLFSEYKDDLDLYNVLNLIDFKHNWIYECWLYQE